MHYNCDKCGQTVPGNNNAVELSVRIGALTDFGALFLRPRHLLPIGNCEGSPSRAQYLEGQPRDTRGYVYDHNLEPTIREAYTKMQEQGS